MESEDEMQDAWAGTSDGEFDYKLEEEDDDTDNLASDDENDESDYGFDYSNADDLHPSSRLPQVLFSSHYCGFLSSRCCKINSLLCLWDQSCLRGKRMCVCCVVELMQEICL